MILNLWNLNRKSRRKSCSRIPLIPHSHSNHIFVFSMSILVLCVFLAFPVSLVLSTLSSVLFFASFFFCCLSIFLHPKKTIFVESARVLLFSFVSSRWWAHFPRSDLFRQLHQLLFILFSWIQALAIIPPFPPPPLPPPRTRYTLKTLVLVPYSSGSVSTRTVISVSVPSPCYRSST